MRSPRTLSIGGATYDLFVRTNKELLSVSAEAKTIDLPIGSKLRVQQVIETCGGGASNTAVGLKRLGCDAGFMGIVGSDQWGERLLANFDAEGVNTESVTVVEDETTSFSIILSVSSGERIILYDPGTNSHLHDTTFDREAAAKADWIYLNHIHEYSAMIEDDLIELLEKPTSPRMTWNPGGRHLEVGLQEESNRRLLKNTALLILNKEEACAFAGATDVPEALKILQAGGAGIVCITDGKHGSFATDGQSVCHCPIIETAPVVDTTGAGDAFGTGATWALLGGKDLPTMLRAGTINATSVVGVIGAEPGLLTDIEMQRRLKEVQLDVDVTPCGS